MSGKGIIKMGTTIRPELSVKNPYWIEKHRYYELKHFCMQYQIWKKNYKALSGIMSRPKEIVQLGKMRYVSNPTEKTAMLKLQYSRYIDLIERTALKTDPELATYLIKGVTEGISYDLLKIKMDVPCSKDSYYLLYRKFFWLLDKARD